MIPALTFPWWQMPELWWACFGFVLLVWDMFSTKPCLKQISTVSLTGFVFMLILSSFWPNGSNLSAWNGFYLWDPLAIFFKRFFLFSGFLVVWMMRDCEIEKLDQRSEYFILPWFGVTAMGLMASVNDFTTLFVSLELLTITFYVLVSFHRYSVTSLEAGTKYLILGALSTGCLLFGITYIFGFTGSLDFAVVSLKLSQPNISLGLLLGVFFVLIGIGFKIATVPCQWWVPDVYQGAPTPITAFLSVASKAAGVALLLRLIGAAFGTAWEKWTPVIIVIAAASILFGNLGALAQRDVKRLMGYSSISHAGYILMGLVGGFEIGKGAVLFYLGAYALATLLIFGLLCRLTDPLGGSELHRFNGLAKNHPGIAVMMLIGMISLAGVPPLAGFMGKWFVFAAAWQAGHYWLVAIAALGAVASLYYYLAIARNMFFETETTDIPLTISINGAYMLMMVLLSIGIVVTGLAPHLLLALSNPR